jgi:hypothetical protein
LTKLPKNSTKFPLSIQIVSVLPLCHTLYLQVLSFAKQFRISENALYGLPEHWQSFTIFVIFSPFSRPVDVSYQQLFFVTPAYPTLRDVVREA